MDGPDVPLGSPLEVAFRSDYASLCRLAALITGDPARAEELVMDTFARCLRDWKADTNGSAYLRAAVVNRCRNHLRRRVREWRVNAAHAARSPSSVSSVEPDDEVLAAVRKLPPRQRATVVLSYFADLPEAEVAATLGVSVGTVKSQLAKARRTLAVTLKEQS